MKVLLLNPPAGGVVIRDYYCSKTTKSNYLFQPIDLLMQSGVLARDHQVSAIDAVARRMSVSHCLEAAAREKPDAVLGLWGAVTDGPDHEFYRALAKAVPAPIFVTGEVFLADPGEWLLARPFIKGALLRFSSPGLLDYLNGNGPGKGLLVNENGEIKGGPDANPALEFSLGRPRHELFGHDGYRFSFAGGKKFATVLTDFGCPFKCGFCVMASLGYSTRPIHEVMEELEWLSREGTRELFVTDQCFGARRKRSLELCKAMAGLEKGFGFTTFTRADLLDEELLSAMKRAGCHTLIMGVESADQKTLETYGKGLSPEKLRQGFELCRSMGIRTVATFIIGLPEDTEESIRATMKLARDLDPDFASYNVAVPRSNTALKAAADKEGLARSGVDPDQGGERASMRTRALSPEEVEKLKREAVRDFYLRPGYLLKRLGSVGSPLALLAEAREGAALVWRNFK